MMDLRTLVDGTLVPHQAFEDATQRLEQCFNYSASSSEPICVALVGESRTGKSRVLEESFTRHPQLRNPDGLETPILRVKTPSKPTVKSLVELMLRAMNDPRSDVGTENAKTARLQTLMKACDTRMVMIDEFQHFVDKGSQKVMHHVADWLKILVDDSRVALVVAGLPALLETAQQKSSCTTKAAKTPTDVKIRDYLAELSRRGAPLPRRAGQPNRKAIARACGVERSVLYRNVAVRKLLKDFADSVAPP